MSADDALTDAIAVDGRLSPRELAALQRMLAIGYAVGGLTGVGVVLLPGPEHHHPGLAGVVVVELLVALLFAVLRNIPEAGVKFVGGPLSVILISVATAVASAIVIMPVYFLWPAIICGHFGNRRDALVVSVLMCIGLAVALAAGSDVRAPLVTYASVVSVFLVALHGYQRLRANTLALTRELALAASTDALTGLLNRRAFGEAFTREVERAEVSDLPLSVVLFDLDHFKHLNDEFGHAAGDRALVAFADVARRRCSCKTDVLARMGGEEFAVVLFDTDGHTAQGLAEEVSQQFTAWSGTAGIGPLTASAGVVTLAPGFGDPADLLVAADRALYAAKLSGRNRVVHVGTVETGATAV